MTIFIQDLPNIQYITWLFFLYIFKDINIVLFAKLRHKSVFQYAIEFSLTFMQTFFILVLIIEISNYFNVDVSKSSQNYYPTVGLKILSESFLKFNFCLGMIVVIQWIRVFMVFQASRVFGKMVEIILNMMTEIAKFMVILGILTIAFSSAGRIFFFDITKFETDTDSIIYLISSALGNFDYSIFTTSDLFLSKYYGYVYQSLFLLMVSIVLLNFLVAILADIYTILQLQAKGLHSRQILLMRSGYDDDAYYSSLVLLPVPLNILMIPFTPFVVLFKSKKLNEILVYVCYLPVLIMSVILFAVGNLILLPIGYLRTILKLIVNAIRNRYSFNSLLRVLSMLISFIFFGLFYFIFIIWIDTAKFAVSLFEKDKNLPKHSKVIKEIAMLDFNFFKVLIEVLNFYNTEEVETKRIINLLQNKLKIIQQIIEILYRRPMKKTIDGISNL